MMELALCYICWMSKWRNRSRYLADVPQDSVGRGDTQSDSSFIQSNPILTKSRALSRALRFGPCLDHEARENSSVGRSVLHRELESRKQGP